jgi:helix-turn-helix, Psq domain
MSEITLDRDAKIAEAIQFYRDNETDPDYISLRQIALRYGINATTLSNRLRNKTGSRALTGGQNKVFSKAESDALLSYIQDQAYNRNPCTFQMIFSAIEIIKGASSEDPPSTSFVRKYIKTLPIKKDQVEANGFQTSDYTRCRTSN